MLLSPALYLPTQTLDLVLAFRATKLSPWKIAANALWGWPLRNPIQVAFWRCLIPVGDRGSGTFACLEGMLLTPDGRVLVFSLPSKMSDHNWTYRLLCFLPRPPLFFFLTLIFVSCFESQPYLKCLFHTTCIFSILAYPGRYFIC